MLGARIAAARQRVGLRQIDLATAMGERYDHTVISAVEHNRSSLRLDGLARAAQELGVSTDYLLGLTDDPTPIAALLTADADSENTDGVRPVDVRELAAAAGGGALDLAETVEGHIFFRRAWLNSHDLDPTRCVVIGVTGESMEPTLPEGCSILVDRSRRKLRVGHIFVVRTDDGLIVKRAAKDANTDWRLVSDHPSWQPLSWPIEAKVIGEVKWMARTL